MSQRKIAAELSRRDLMTYAGKPWRSDKNQGGSDRQCRLIQLFRHQIQLLTARPAPAEPHHRVAKLECLVSSVTNRDERPCGAILNRT